MNPRMALCLLLLPTLCWAGKGDRFPAENRLVADEPGFSVMQLTTHPADDAGLYFTNEAYVPATNTLVFTSKRSGSWNLYAMDLGSYEFVQLTDSKRISGTGAVVAPETREAFYKDGNQIKAVSLTTLKERVVTDLMKGFIVSAAVTASPDGKVLAVSQVEDIPITTRTNVIYSDMDERFEKRPFSEVYTGNADGSDWHMVAGQQKWISHVLLGPKAPYPVLYCHEGRWNQVEQRMWLVDRDDQNNRKLRPEETPELSIGHEYFFPDGIHVGYHGIYPAPAKRSFVGVADIRDGSYHEYVTPRGNMHTHANADGTLFVSDGSKSEPYISVYTLREGKLEGGQLFRHGGSFDKQEWHPHPRFLPDGRRIVFTSNRDGAGDVYLLQLK